MRNWREFNALALAYLGDAVYELWVREHLLELGFVKVKELHRKAVERVRASTQARVLAKLLDALEPEEQEVVLWARNAKGGYPRNVDVLTYRHATAFEALVGYWYLQGLNERMEWAFAQVEAVLPGKGKSAAEAEGKN
ncbi:ribonuclease III [Acididesulfobacillus acetoxydans]|uniref:Mini-ribonuclease 3 n=1 Tax=Acididesulfobacillus acetoxydans TaxID=1561005 RepID=A0A8S0VVS6_9FIRM|nr:ribonuclease III domain-containing protein [Acididesulfobacillus acetoxydans]CAA7600073.1 ribonuclease III [Acididesulfobacillus acetoxydans]CEJ07848.1 Mini-ribonuclease 3 [Acididesulfobacillus acetoxydans]